MQPVPDNKKVLVVGTTSDYIDWIRNFEPGRALFVTDPKIRSNAPELPPDKKEEILHPLDDAEKVTAAVAKHLAENGLELSGVACFDCENMFMASSLAAAFGLPYPGFKAISNCRDKYLSKQIWKKNQVACPDVRPVTEKNEVLAFFASHPSGIVLKPMMGAGSELVFNCRTPQECKDSFKTVMAGLKKRRSNPLFCAPGQRTAVVLAEETIDGLEFSCDFIIREHRLTIIRLTRKIKPANKPFGTVSGYIIPASLPGTDTLSRLESELIIAARSLGIESGICMVDFIVTRSGPVLIEMTPRPGGDCLPFLLKEAAGIDILSLTLDVAENRPVRIPGMDHCTPCIGMRLHASKSGVLKNIDISAIKEDSRVRQIRLIRSPGHVVTLPPDDYDSWFLGHLIVAPGPGSYPETQALLISKRIKIDIEGK